MARFTEIVKQAHRMCETYGPHDNDCTTLCPLGRANNPAGMKLCECIGFTDLESAKEIEKRVLAWAAEHPEPVYPSWNEAWKELFPQAKYIPCPELYFGVEGCDHDDKFCVNCKSRPIPAEIAEKLGIRPKEG